MMLQARALFLFIWILCDTFASSWSACGYRSTGYNTDGKGNMVYFDRHHLRCEDRGMRSFKLDRGSRDTIRFEYECCDLPRKRYTRTFQTPFTYDGKGNLVYLDRQRVSCGVRGILSGFNMLRNPRQDHIRFNVICNEYNRLSCRSPQYTRFNNDGGGNSVYLDRHRVQCSGSYSLNSFRLERTRNHKEIRMVYKCCRPT